MEHRPNRRSELEPRRPIRKIHLPNRALMNVTSSNHHKSLVSREFEKVRCSVSSFDMRNSGQSAVDLGSRTGIVIRAFDRELERDVASKELTPDDSMAEGNVDRRIEKIRITGCTAHPLREDPQTRGGLSS